MTSVSLLKLTAHTWKLMERYFLLVARRNLAGAMLSSFREFSFWSNFSWKGCFLISS